MGAVFVPIIAIPSFDFWPNQVGCSSLWLPFFAFVSGSILSLVFHESGHIISARLWGIKVQSINYTHSLLFPLVSVSFDKQEFLEAGELAEKAVAMAGIFHNLILSQLLWFLARKVPYGYKFVDSNSSALLESANVSVPCYSFVHNLTQTENHGPSLMQFTVLDYPWSKPKLIKMFSFQKPKLKFLKIWPKYSFLPLSLPAYYQYFLRVTALISWSIAMLNLLPFPGLDGHFLY